MTNTTNNANKVTLISRNDDGTINKSKTAAKIAAYAIIGIGGSLTAQNLCGKVQATQNHLIESEIERLTDKAYEERLAVLAAASEDARDEHQHNSEVLTQDAKAMKRTLFASNFISGMAMGACSVIAAGFAAKVMRFIDKK